MGFRLSHSANARFSGGLFHSLNCEFWPNQANHQSNSNSLRRTVWCTDVMSLFGLYPEYATRARHDYPLRHNGMRVTSVRFPGGRVCRVHPRERFAGCQTRHGRHRFETAWREPRMLGAAHAQGVEFIADGGARDHSGHRILREASGT